MATIRSKAMLSAARGQHCINCGARDDTVVAAHYTGLRAHQYGKGTSHKPHDLLVADLCMKCHSSFDLHTQPSLFKGLEKKIDLSEQFLHLIIKTLLRRIDQGVITVKGVNNDRDEPYSPVREIPDEREGN